MVFEHAGAELGQGLGAVSIVGYGGQVLIGEFLDLDARYPVQQQRPEVDVDEVVSWCAA